MCLLFQIQYIFLLKNTHVRGLVQKRVNRLKEIILDLGKIGKICMIIIYISVTKIIIKH